MDAVFQIPRFSSGPRRGKQWFAAVRGTTIRGAPARPYAIGTPVRTTSWVSVMRGRLPPESLPLGDDPRSEEPLSPRSMTRAHVGPNLRERRIGLLGSSTREVDHVGLNLCAVALVSLPTVEQTLLLIVEPVSQSHLLFLAGGAALAIGQPALCLEYRFPVHQGSTGSRSQDNPDRAHTHGSASGKEVRWLCSQG